MTKQHELSVQAVTLDSEWQTGLPWMRLDTESMPLLLDYHQLTVLKTIEAEVMAECYDEAMTGEVSQFEDKSVLLAHDQLRLEKPMEGEVRVKNLNIDEFYHFEDTSVLLAHDQLRVENPIEGKVRVKYFNSFEEEEFSNCKDNSTQIQNLVFSIGAGSARVQINLLVDLVMHGWTKTLRIINYLLAVPKLLKHKLHLIPDKDCVHL